MTYPLGTFFRIRWGMSASVSAALAALLTLVAIHSASFGVEQTSLTPYGEQATASGADTSLAALAAKQPRTAVEVIVRLEAGTSAGEARALVQAAGGSVSRDLHVINALGARMSAAAAHRLTGNSQVRTVSLNAAVKPSSMDTSELETAYNGSIRATTIWNSRSSGRESIGTGIGVAVIDTGIQGDLPDFRVSQSDSRSRVIASAVVNPNATTPGDEYGHGTHVAGIVAGNGTARPSSDPLYGKYVGVAPGANLISIKASDDEGNATAIDVIDGLQFAIDHKSDYNIRVVNLSLSEEEPSSYKTNPLNAAVEQAWNAGIAVVAAAGNRGTAADAVHYAPGNDPFVITVGAADDRGTVDRGDDVSASWSSIGTTQDGHAKPEFLAPGAHIVSTLSPGSKVTEMCSSCLVDDKYFRMGGTSMATAVASGTAALMIENEPALTPNKVKSAIAENLRDVPGPGSVLDALEADKASDHEERAPNSYEPNSLIDSATGLVDFTRSSWSRSSWRTADGNLAASWARSSWRCVSCAGEGDDEVDPTRSSWSRSSWRRSSWRRSSWSASFTK
jgi:serine protease AprX